MVLGRADLIRWKSLAGTSADLLAFLEAVTGLTMAFHNLRVGFDGLYLHDPLALAVALDPSLVKTRKARLEVETAGAARGRVRAFWDEGAPSAVATAVEAERFLTLVKQVLTGL